jgi:2-(1,2-epoxy-1,2-dihydrophenyl)acetyl-CoA isomerase
MNAPREPTVLARHADGVALLTLNRPAALNALNLAMIDDLRRAAQAALDDPAVGAIVVTGAGDHFMAGGDLKWFHQQLALGETERRILFEDLIGRVHATTLLLKEGGKPVVAAVRGAAAGFGLSLVLASDLAVAAEDAYFTLAYRHIGISPDGGATWSLPRLVGAKRAAEIALLGDRFDAHQALEWGLVNRVVAQEAVFDTALTLAKRLADGPRQALAATRALLQRSLTATRPSNWCGSRPASPSAPPNPP